MDGTVMLVVEDADNFRGQSMVPPAQVGMMTKWKQLKTLVVKHDIEERTMHMQSPIPAQPAFVTSHDDHFRQGSRTQSTEAPVPRASSPCRFSLTIERRRRFASTGKALQPHGWACASMDRDVYVGLRSCRAKGDPAKTMMVLTSARDLESKNVSRRRLFPYSRPIEPASNSKPCAGGPSESTIRFAFSKAAIVASWRDVKLPSGHPSWYAQQVGLNSIMVYRHCQVQSACRLGINSILCFL